jgi:hypothetical protein
MAENQNGKRGPRRRPAFEMRIDTKACAQSTDHKKASLSDALLYCIFFVDTCYENSSPKMG